MILFLLARTPDAPIVKEVKPAAMIGYRAVKTIAVTDKHGNGNLFEPHEERLGGELELRQTESAYEKVGGLVVSVVDTGENGVFTRGEFAAITAHGQMEYITPEEIARVVVLEIRGANTGQDVVSALDSAVSFGSTVLGALFGRKLTSRTNVSKASTSVRSLGRAAEQRGDIARAKEDHEEAQRKLMELEKEFAEETKSLEAEYDVENLELEELTVKPRKSDIGVQRVALAWTPWRVDSAGIAEPVY